MIPGPFSFSTGNAKERHGRGPDLPRCAAHFLRATRSLTLLCVLLTRWKLSKYDRVNHLSPKADSLRKSQIVRAIVVQWSTTSTSSGG